MDFSLNSLRRLRYNPPNPTNATSVSSAQLPTILDAFIPGYTFFCKLVRDDYGFDVSNLVFTLFAFATCTTAFRYLVNMVGSLLFRYFTAAVTVDSDDSIYDCLLDWAADHPTLNAARSLHVRSVVEEAPADKDLSHVAHGFHKMESSNGRISSTKPKKPILVYDIYKGAHWFRHNGHLYRFARADQQALGTFEESRKRLTVTIVGRSTKPIKDLIAEAIETFISKQAGQRQLEGIFKTLSSSDSK